MKRVLIRILIIAVVVFIFAEDWISVKFGWKEAPPEPLTPEQISAIDDTLRRLDLAPLRLSEVQFQKQDSEDPIFDYLLEFRLNRALTDAELAAYHHHHGVWEYSIHLTGPDALSSYHPLNTLTFLPSDQDSERMIARFDESTLHPRKHPKGTERAFSSRVDNAFRPGGLKAFAFRLYRRKSVLPDEFGRSNLALVAEWRSENLEESAPGHWRVPDGADSTPTAEAHEAYKGMNHPPAP